MTLVAGLTLLPALLSLRLSLLAQKRTVFQRIFGKPKLLPWSIQGSGKPGTWGRIATRIVRHPVPTLVTGLVVFGGLAFAVLGYTASGFGGSTAPPAHSDSAAGQALLTRHFPQSSANPTSLIFRFADPVWEHPAALAAGTQKLKASGLFTTVSRPAEPGGRADHAGRFHRAARQARPGQRAAAGAPAGHHRAAAGLRGLPGHRQLHQPGRAHGAVLGRAEGRRPGRTPGHERGPVPARQPPRQVGKSIGAADSGVGGEAPALYDISSISNNDLVRVIPIAILAIGILLALVLRSLVAPLYLIASVGLSYLAALGLSVLLFVEIGNSGGLVFFLPFLMFIFLLALGEDYNILVMTRIREEAAAAAAAASGLTGAERRPARR